MQLHKFGTTLYMLDSTFILSQLSKGNYTIMVNFLVAV